MHLHTTSKILLRIVVVCIILFWMLFFVYMLTGCEGENRLSGTDIINSGQFNTANHKQFASTVQLGVDGKQLYKSENGILSVWSNDSFKDIFWHRGESIAFVNGFFYYSKFISDDSMKIYSYDLKNGDKYTPMTVELHYVRDVYCEENGMLNIPQDYQRSVYHGLKDAQILTDSQKNEVYEMSGYSYLLVGEKDRQELVRISASGDYYSYEEQIPYGSKSMIPCSEGLIIHNEGQGDILYFVEENTGEIVELFSVNCIVSTSAVNVHDCYAYLSLIRYSEWGELQLGVKSDPDDEVNGTYRINLKDYSVEKISSDIYTGMFIFDDSGIFACKNEGTIYKLDFEGNVLQKID